MHVAATISVPCYLIIFYQIVGDIFSEPVYLAQEPGTVVERWLEI